jgi:hypothetical protein
LSGCGKARWERQSGKKGRAGASVGYARDQIDDSRLPPPAAKRTHVIVRPLSRLRQQMCGEMGLKIDQYGEQRNVTRRQLQISLRH